MSLTFSVAMLRELCGDGYPLAARPLLLSGCLDEEGRPRLHGTRRLRSGTGASSRCERKEASA